jgi:hypothetical protein
MKYILALIMFLQGILILFIASSGGVKKGGEINVPLSIIGIFMGAFDLAIAVLLMIE